MPLVFIYHVDHVEIVPIPNIPIYYNCMMIVSNLLVNIVFSAIQLRKE